jgi:hypothetical protein
VSDAPQIPPGLKFKVCVSAEMPLDKIRKKALKNWGLSVHISAKMGPIHVDQDGKLIDCPIEAIDDEILEGSFSIPLFAPGYVLYFGHFKEKEV